MKDSVSTTSPVAVGLDAGHPLWWSHVGGIVRSCCCREVEHAPTVIGWSVNETGGKCWSVSGSWFPEVGLGGWNLLGHARFF